MPPKFSLSTFISWHLVFLNSHGITHVPRKQISSRDEEKRTATKGKPMTIRSLLEVHLQRKLQLAKEKKKIPIPSGSVLVGVVVDKALVVPW